MICLNYLVSPNMRLLLFIFFNDTATTEIYTLSLHDALPIFTGSVDLTVTDRIVQPQFADGDAARLRAEVRKGTEDRKSTRLNSSHMSISYAVFCLKKKKKDITL